MKNTLLLATLTLFVFAGCGSIGRYHEKPPVPNETTGRMAKSVDSPVEILNQEPSRPYEVLCFTSRPFAFTKERGEELFKERIREFGGDAVIMSSPMDGRVIAWK